MAEKKYDSGLVWRMGTNLTLNLLYGGYCSYATSMNSENIAHSLGWGDSTQTYMILLSSIYAIGAACGGILGSVLAHRYGRRYAMIISDIIGIVACSFFLIPLTLTFTIGRFGSGIVHGVAMAITPPFLKELSPPDISGRVGALVQLQTTTGILFVYCLGLALPIDDYSGAMNRWWMFMMVLPATFLMVQMFCLLYIHPYDSPNWLVANNKMVEASNVLTHIYSKDAVESVTRTLALIYTKSGAPEGLMGAGLIGRSAGFKELVTSWRFRRMMISGCGLMFLRSWCGVNAVFMYSTTIFASMTDKFTARVYTVIIGVVNVSGVLVAVYYLLTIGRRRDILGYGELGLGIIHIALSIVSAAELSDDLLVVMIGLFIVMYSSTIGTVVWVYIAEILSIRGMGLAVCFGMLNQFVVVLSFQFIIVPGLHSAFLLYGIICISGFFFIFSYLIETKGLTKEECFQKNIVTEGYFELEGK
jgi:SP family sugar porter-like MFS transporter